MGQSKLVYFVCRLRQHPFWKVFDQDLFREFFILPKELDQRIGKLNRSFDFYLVNSLLVDLIKNTAQ